MKIERVDIVRGSYNAYKALANHTPSLINDHTIYFIYNENKTEGALYMGNIPYIKIGGGGQSNISIAFNEDTNTLGYYENDIWYPVVKISPGGQTGDANKIHIIDADELFNAGNVEDALKELQQLFQNNNIEITNLNDQKQDKIINEEAQVGQLIRIAETDELGLPTRYEAVDYPTAGSLDHDDLINRDKENQHPISAITNLQQELDNKANSDSILFSSIDTNTLKIENNILSINVTDDAEADNTRPITSSGVNTIVGNINILLSKI